MTEGLDIVGFAFLIAQATKEVDWPLTEWQTVRFIVSGAIGGMAGLRVMGRGGQEAEKRGAWTFLGVTAVAYLFSQFIIVCVVGAVVGVVALKVLPLAIRLAADTSRDVSREVGRFRGEYQASLPGPNEMNATELMIQQQLNGLRQQGVPDEVVVEQEQWLRRRFGQ